MRDRDLEDYTKTWPDGAPVTNRHDPTMTGVVIAIYRIRDDARFTKVRVDGTGAKVWANQDWVLGVGARLRRCPDCEQVYRTDQAEADFCPTCTRAQRPSHDPESPSLSRFNVNWKSESRGAGRKGRLR